MIKDVSAFINEYIEVSDKCAVAKKNYSDLLKQRCHMEEEFFNTFPNSTYFHLIRIVANKHIEKEPMK